MMMNPKKYLTYDVYERTYMSYASCSHIQKAERLNLARTLLQRYRHWPEAAQQLARNCSISERQAYRYLEQAQRLKHPVPVGDVKVSFTVKLSRRLVQRLRAYAASTGLTLSEIASRAFSAILHRGGGRG